MASKPELMYFNVPGRVAGIRIAMFVVYGKDGWVDKRLEFAQWPETKKTLPLQFLPVLTFPDGTKVHQADAILRFLGKQCDMYPTCLDDKSLLDALKIDEMVTTIFEALGKAPRPSNLITKEMMPDLWAEFLVGQNKLYFDYIETKLNEHPGSPFFNGKSLTIADLTLYMLINYFTNGEISFIPKDYLDGWPMIKAHHAAVLEHESVRDWRAAYDSKKDAISEVKDFEKVDTNASGYAK